MHAKHDYNPVKTAYPVDSVPEFDDGEYPEVTADGRPSEAAMPNSRIVIESEDAIHQEEDRALLKKSQQSAFHQSEDFQGAQAYKSQGYEPTSTELESTISWGLLIGCTIFFVLFILIGIGIFSIATVH
ncbi:MAG: hypothetical protein FWC86_01865 [Coriobacteriia bacterium]|nr:hypothetical protein [Coriobacteriia bacterium]